MSAAPRRSETTCKIHDFERFAALLSCVKAYTMSRVPLRERRFGVSPEFLWNNECCSSEVGDNRHDTRFRDDTYVCVKAYTCEKQQYGTNAIDRSGEWPSKRKKENAKSRKCENQKRPNFRYMTRLLAWQFPTLTVIFCNNLIWLRTTIPEAQYAMFSESTSELGR